MSEGNFVNNFAAYARVLTREKAEDLYTGRVRERLCEVGELTICRGALDRT